MSDVGGGEEVVVASREERVREVVKAVDVIVDFVLVYCDRQFDRHSEDEHYEGCD